jgi:hypothetical protein
MLAYGRLPGNKYMIHWPLSGNDYYANLVEMDHKARRDAINRAKQKTLCFVYFIKHELGYNTLALADDEFPTPDRLPFIPYYRESRRIRGKVRFTLNHISDPYNQPEKLYRTSVAVGDYPLTIIIRHIPVLNPCLTSGSGLFHPTGYRLVHLSRLRQKA